MKTKRKKYSKQDTWILGDKISEKYNLLYESVKRDRFSEISFIAFSLAVCVVAYRVDENLINRRGLNRQITLLIWLERMKWKVPNLFSARTLRWHLEQVYMLSPSSWSFTVTSSSDSCIHYKQQQQQHWQCCARPANWAILLETGSCAIIIVYIDQGNCQSHTALRATEKKFPLILDRGSQSCLSWFIVSLVLCVCE